MLRFGRRQLHTIISREIIKPSPSSHLQTYNLSQLDQHAPHSYVPFIFFYPNNRNRNLSSDDKARELKNSLSQTLTRYYPFAGRLNSPYNIDCNDEGVVFVEAKNDSQLEMFQHMSEEDPTVNQLFADGMMWENQNPHRTSLIGVQLNHFACGGIGLAVSMSHRIGDGCTIGSYMAHWASVARYGSTDHKEVLSFNPHFIKSPATITSLPHHSSDSNQRCADYVTRKFVFPNSKLNEIKNKVGAGSIINPTRVEVLSSLIYKTAVAAAASAKSGSFKPSFLVIPVDIRRKFVPKLPETTVGNFISLMLVTTRHESEISLSKVVSEIKKEKMELNRVQSMQQACENIESFMSRLGNEVLENVANRSIWCSSLCGFPYNKVDFGWGKPTGATMILGSSNKACFMLMDTPDGNGIQARVVLKKENMEIFENDKELLSFCQN